MSLCSYDFIAVEGLGINIAVLTGSGFGMGRKTINLKVYV